MTTFLVGPLWGAAADKWNKHKVRKEEKEGEKGGDCAFALSRANDDDCSLLLLSLCSSFIKTRGASFMR